MVKRIISIDIETYSTKDLNICGVYVYSEDEDFEILLLAMPLMMRLKLLR